MLVETRKPLSILIFSVCLVLFLTACNLPQEDETPAPGEKLTEIYATIEVKLTESGTQTPQPTAAATQSGSVTETATPQPSPTLSTPVPTIAAATPTNSTPCDLAAPGNPIDVTIPDDTAIPAGQAFTKTWRLQNIGDCTWTKNYAVIYFSGERMGAPASVPLAGDVLPGQSVDISVDMIAPTTAGKFQGNWKLRNSSNTLFGIGTDGGAPFWVRIVVQQTPTPTSTKPTPTSTITPTAPPAIKVSGNASLVVNNSIDLDTNQIISEIGGDVAYQVNEFGQHILNPQSGALIGMYGSTQPSLINCQATAVGSAPIIVESLTGGTYLCYRTNQNSPGRMLLSAISASDFTLSLEVLTWAVP